MPRRKITTERTLPPVYGELEFERLIKKDWFIIEGYREYKTKTTYVVKNDNWESEFDINKFDLESFRKSPKDYADALSALYRFEMSCARRERQKRLEREEREWLGINDEED